MSDISVMKICPVCYKYNTCKVNMEKYYQYLKSKSNITLFDSDSENKKRFLSTGICLKCQEKIYKEFSLENKKMRDKRLRIYSKC